MNPNPVNTPVQVRIGESGIRKNHCPIPQLVSVCFAKSKDRNETRRPPGGARGSGWRAVTRPRVGALRRAGL